MKFRRILVLPVLLILAGTALAACGSGSGDRSLQVSDAWARSTAPGQTTGAIYATITGGAEADRLVGVKVPADVAAKAETHESSADPDMASGAGHDSGDQMNSGDASHMESDSHMSSGNSAGMESGDHMNGRHDSGAMTMKQVEGIDIPADGSVNLEPGGFHIMLFDLAGPLKAGDTIPVTLTFEQAGEVKVDAEVRDS